MGKSPKKPLQSVQPREKATVGKACGLDDLHPDAWERFEKAVDKVAKSPPQHKNGSKSGKRDSR